MSTGSQDRIFNHLLLTTIVHDILYSMHYEGDGLIFIPKGVWASTRCERIHHLSICHGMAKATIDEQI